MSRRASWLTVRDESALRRLVLSPLAPVSWLYAAVAVAHRALYRRGILSRRHFPGRVVSVGNLVAGGTGKTPLAAWLATELHRRGHRVALASRGYGGRGADAVTVVSDGRFVRSSAEAVGDEAFVLAAHASGVPVLVGRDRALVGWRALSAFGTEVLVLDDGFQHHRLDRQVDIVSFDGGLGLGNGHLLPRGPMREPLRALYAADVVAVVDGPLSARDATLLSRAAPQARRFDVQRVPLGLRPLRGGPLTPASQLRGAEVGLLAGVANPAGFRRTVEALGARVIASRYYGDHHRYRAWDLHGLAGEAVRWITTEKDAVKILPAWIAGADVQVLPISLRVEAGGELLDWIEFRLR